MSFAGVSSTTTYEYVSDLSGKSSSYKIPCVKLFSHLRGMKNRWLVLSDYF